MTNTVVQLVSAAAAGWAGLRGPASGGPSAGPLSRREASAQRQTSAVPRSGGIGFKPRLDECRHLPA